MRFAVDSDYLPMPWVRGDHFRDKQHANKARQEAKLGRQGR
jgi:hypothetical protein